MLKKKNKIITPESRIEGADIHVIAQQDQFTKMIEEVQWAKQERVEAIKELEKEVASLEARLDLKKKWIQRAKDQNQADDGFIKQLNRLLGN